MNAPKKKNKSLLETLSKEDVVTLIRKCYWDKLVYGHVRWKELNRKDFEKQYSVNNFKNIWRLIKKKFNVYKEEHRDLFSEIETDAKDALYRNNEIKKSKKLSLLIPLNSKTSLSNISLLRNFTRVNSFFFKCCSNYYSPLNGVLKGSPRNFLSTSEGRLSKGEEANGEEANGEEANGEEANGEEANGEEANGEGMMGKRAIGERMTERINYIQRNIKDIQRRSEFLDLYFMVISLIHRNKKYALLKKMEQLYYENKLLKCCNNINSIYNNYILYILKRINEISIGTINSLKNICTTKMEKNFGSSKFMNNKNSISIEIEEKVYQFNKTLINYKIFYNLFKQNINLNNNKVICFFIPLPKKPNNLIFKNSNFYYLNKPIYLTTNLDEDIYNYIYIFHKFFLSFMFWSFYLKYQNIDKMKEFFNKELELLYYFFEKYNTTMNEEYFHKKKWNYINKQTNIVYAILFDFKIEYIISLCLCVIKMYLKIKKKIDINYLTVVKILNFSLHPICKKNITRHYLVHLRRVHRILLKLRSTYDRRKRQSIRYVSASRKGWGPQKPKRLLRSTKN
ncbi:hypothetical protein, conserved [Plasmodium ovale curtisi]|uniref:Uncharacterized protein n=1 Tax=Plasmodium ovale curtisi TaxID=864141 RepID=A0A1A8W4B1_PLAOA|nr:hypothetical protein, conserved [Plasmodium ovale curtisi]